MHRIRQEPLATVLGSAKQAKGGTSNIPMGASYAALSPALKKAPQHLSNLAERLRRCALAVFTRSSSADSTLGEVRAARRHEWCVPRQLRSRVRIGKSVALKPERVFALVAKPSDAVVIG